MDALRSVDLKESVQFAGQSARTLIADKGVRLSIDMDLRMIRAEPAPGKHHLTIMIPLEMVKNFVLQADFDDVESAKASEAQAAAEARQKRLDEQADLAEAQIALAAQRKADADALRAQARAADAEPQGVEKYVKDPVTGVIKTIKV